MFQAALPNSPPGKARWGVEPKRTTQEAVKATVPTTPLSQGLGPLRPGFGCQCSLAVCVQPVFREALSVGIFCCEIPVGVLVWRALGLGPAFSPTVQSDRCPEEVLECAAAWLLREEAVLGCRQQEKQCSLLQCCLVPPGVDATAATDPQVLPSWSVTRCFPGVGLWHWLLGLVLLPI